MPKKDYYEQLGVGKGATDSELKSAYRKLAKQYHPDANPGNAQAEAKFKELSEAYAVLSDGEKRAAYDNYGHAAFEGPGGGGGGFHSAHFDMDDILSSFFGGGFGGNAGQRRNGPARGADLQMRMRIAFEDAVFGAQREIEIATHDTCDTCKGNGAKPGTYPETCRECGGSGQVRVVQQTLLGAMQSVRTCSACRGEGKIVKDPCPTCRGAGKVRANKTLQITIPKGIDSGQSIRLAGKGEPGEPGGPPGDLLITMQVQPHKVFRRDGNDLFLEIPITFVQATLGDEISVPMLDGTEEKQSILPGTQPGTVLRIRGKGVPSVRNNRNVGDVVVTLNVTVPTRLTDKQKDQLRAFNEAMGDDYKNHKKNWFDKLKASFK